MKEYMKPEIEVINFASESVADFGGGVTDPSTEVGGGDDI